MAQVGLFLVQVGLLWPKLGFLAECSACGSKGPVNGLVVTLFWAQVEPFDKYIYENSRGGFHSHTS
jgi:hypothetical protein